MKRIIEDIKKKSWYKQGGAVLGFFLHTPYLSIYEEIGHHNVYVISKGEWNGGYFEKMEEKKNAEQHIKTHLSDPDFLNERIKKWRVLAKEAQGKLSQVMDLEPSEDNKLGKLMKEYCRLSINAWKVSLVIEAFDPWGEHFIKEYCGKYNLSDEEIAIMTSPNDLTFVQKEILDRFDIAKSKDLGKVKQHYKKYYWYKTSWQHAPLTDEEHFEKIIKDNIKKFNGFKKEAEGIKKHHDEIKEKRKSIIKIHEIDEVTQKVLNFFTILNDWRDERKKELACKINYELWILLNKLVKYNKKEFRLLETISVVELESFKLSDKYLEELEERTKGYYVMYYNEKDKLSWIYGKDADNVFKALEGKLKEGVNEIKGRPAYKGKAKGKAKIINSIKEFSKMHEGDILVSIMTRPEMVPVMRKAAAIVTDEGGMTCHAAIVARELKKPCIVGTQIATSSLKDGQEVEVDAEKGIVKILKA